MGDPPIYQIGMGGSPMGGCHGNMRLFRAAGGAALGW
jgi:hypothetical protein